MITDPDETKTTSERHGSAVNVSIIINNYNYGGYLARAIDSSLAQVHPCVEVIVVDDGSTDESVDVISTYGDRVTPVLKANGGQASAMNAGLARAAGDWVLFLDADDELLPNAVSEAIRVAAPDVAKVQWRLSTIDDDSTVLSGLLTPAGGIPMPEPDSVLPSILRTGRYVGPPTSGNMISRAALEKMGPVPEEDYRINADAFFVLSAPFFGRVVSLDKALGNYRSHSRNQWKPGDGWIGRHGLEGMKHDRVRHTLIRQRAADAGLVVGPLERNDATYAMARLLAIKFAAPGETDGSLLLAWWHFVLAVGCRRPREILLATWAAGVALAPLRLARRLATLYIVPGARNAKMQRLMRLIRRFT